jgi:hypothetical protein
MRQITDADVDAAVQLIEKCQDVYELDATMRDIMKAIPISEVPLKANSIQSLPLEQIDNALRTIRVWNAAISKQNCLMGLVETQQ